MSESLLYFWKLSSVIGPCPSFDYHFLNIFFEYMFWIYFLNIFFEYSFWIYCLNIFFEYIFWIYFIGPCPSFDWHFFEYIFEYIYFLNKILISVPRKRNLFILILFLLLNVIFSEIQIMDIKFYKPVLVIVILFLKVLDQITFLTTRRQINN